MQLQLSQDGPTYCRLEAPVVTSAYDKCGIECLAALDTS